MSFKIEDDNVLAKYNEIWNRILKILNTKIHSDPVYDGKYIKHFKKSLTQLFQTVKLKKNSTHYVSVTQ